MGALRGAIGEHTVRLTDFKEWVVYITNEMCDRTISLPEFIPYHKGYEIRDTVNRRAYEAGARRVEYMMAYPELEKQVRAEIRAGLLGQGYEEGPLADLVQYADLVQHKYSNWSLSKLRFLPFWEELEVSQFATSYREFLRLLFGERYAEKMPFAPKEPQYILFESPQGEVWLKFNVPLNTSQGVSVSFMEREVQNGSSFFIEASGGIYPETQFFSGLPSLFKEMGLKVRDPMSGNIEAPERAA